MAGGPLDFLQFPLIARPRWLVHLYPREWRNRYGEEFEALLQDGPGGLRALVEVLSSR